MFSKRNVVLHKVKYAEKYKGYKRQTSQHTTPDQADHCYTCYG